MSLTQLVLPLSTLPRSDEATGKGETKYVSQLRSHSSHDVRGLWALLALLNVEGNFLSFF